MGAGTPYESAWAARRAQPLAIGDFIVARPGTEVELKGKANKNFKTIILKF